MKAAGVRPSWISEFRNCGARSVEDILTIANAGVTAADAKALRSKVGEQRSAHSPKRFRQLTDLIAAHRKVSGS